MGRLDNKVVVITGASTGIGRATMERIASEGGTVVGCSRTKATLEEALDSALALGGRGNIFAADLREDGSAGALIADTVKRYGRVDALVNNAGVGWQYGIDNPGSMAALHET
ncbi:SDR family NAD(P)-dependent oxidoreductase, partial [Aestuariivirga sp.]|uniref:SDR family NAD(P)-dependent oxidoreductase n=1 Tax=Aestuariivirga sp. TaxID=2650926 RepID=UPI003018F74C